MRSSRYAWLLFVLFLAALTFASAPVTASQQITTTANTVSESWGTRNRSTSSGQILWFDNNQDVWLYNGSTNVLLQAKGGLTNIGDNVFALGSGSTPGHVIGVWRRDTDFAWLSVDGNTPVQITATNPVNAANPMNPEGVGIEDGCVFLTWQAFDANANTIRNVFKINTSTGASTNLTNVTNVYGIASSSISTSQCKAVWLFDDGTRSNNQIVYKLHYYDGTSISTVDSDTTLGQPFIRNGRIYYTKKVGGVSQVFLYDTTAQSPAPQQLTSSTLNSLTFENILSDGRFVSWTRQTTGGASRSLQLLGGATLADTSTISGVHGFDGGAIVWSNAAGNLRYADANGISTISLAPATTFNRPWFWDGYVAWFGTSSDGGTDAEVFRHTAPAEIFTPPPIAIEARSGIGSAEVAWSSIVGASSYNLYMASVSGVTRDNYAGLAGGKKFTNVTSPWVLTGLTGGQTCYFVVTAVESNVEGPSSREASVTVVNGQWARAFGTSELLVYDVKVDRANGNTLYAAVADTKGVWRSIDGGSTWSPLGGAINGNDVRAVAANGTTVLAVTKAGHIFRSTDSGVTWTDVTSAAIDIGEQQKSIAFDPLNANTVYASDLQLVPSTNNYVVKSTNGGATWTQLPDVNFGGPDLRAYSLAVDAQTSGTLYASGTGVPVAKSTDGGTTWTNVQPSLGFFYAVAVSPTVAGTVYAAGTDFGGTSLGVDKSTNSGGAWTLKNSGFPTPPPTIRALVVEGSNVYAGADSGYYATGNGGDTWSAGPGGTIPSSSLAIKALALTASRRLVAATPTGIYLLALNPAPSVTSLSATSGVATGGETVTVNGTNFSASTGLRVLFGGVDGTVNLGASSSTSIAVTTPAHAAGTVDVTVINPDGQSATLANGFTFIACTYQISPVVASFGSPAATGSVQVTTASGCAWTTTPGAGFVTITGGSSGTGSGTVSYSVAQNSGSTARTTTLTIAGSTFTVNQSASGLAAFALNASAASTQVNLTWDAVAGATSYEVRRSNNGGAYNLVTTTGSTSFNDTTVSAGTGYLYVIFAIGSGGTIAYSNVDLAVPFNYTDPTLTAGSSIIKAAHFSELRLAVNAARAAVGYPALTFTDPSLAGVAVKRIHLIELRQGVDGVRAAAGLVPVGYTDPTITAGTSLVRAAHVLDLRGGLQ